MNEWLNRTVGFLESLVPLLDRLTALFVRFALSLVFLVVFYKLYIAVFFPE